MQLTAGLYASLERGLFDLTCGQMSGRPHEVAHNGRWYNKRGEYLGWGDLSADDIRRISAGLEEGELFIVLHESDSDIMKDAWLVIAKGMIYVLDNYKVFLIEAGLGGLFVVLDHESMNDLITSNQ